MRKRLEKILDDQERQAVYAKRKNMLLRKAMELSVLCDCDVGIVLFNSSGNLCQYSSQPSMDQLLSRYGQACSQPHERHTNEELLEQYLVAHDEPEASTSRIRAGRDAGSLLPIKCTSSSTRDLINPSGQLLQINQLHPPGFMDGRMYPVSPECEAAYDKISTAFDRLIGMQQRADSGRWDGSDKRSREDEAAGQRSPSPLAGGSGGGKRFKNLNLNITVPENTSHHIMPSNLHRQSDGGEGLIESPTLGVANGDHGDKQGEDGSGRVKLERVQSLNLLDSGTFGGNLLSLPSPSNALFSLDNLFTSRGGLNLDLPTPDSTRSLNLDQMNVRGMRWPSPSPSQRSDVIPGFSDDGESGEELMEDLVVTGKAITHMPPDNPAVDIPLEL